ncbi:MAG: hypothetical protein O2944_03080 [Proteobacteria bacterium]|nr:hypothetical protein [Pseudomonadota bacterium]
MNMQNALSLAAKSAVCLVLTASIAAAAGNRVSGEYARSKLPLHKVGALNKSLSALCGRGLFRQRGDLRLSIGYDGKKGYGITGIAKSDYNLYDPTNVAEPDKTYHFYNQGYSNCRVYVAKTPINRR